MENKTRTLDINTPVLDQNNRLAGENRRLFKDKGLFVLNLLSSPGAGKTALLERTLVDLAGELRIGVIVGDLQTDNDARRMSGKGAPVLQINTDGICHLEAAMVQKALSHFNLDELDVLIIENVGNLVCPASFDLGEDVKVALHSVTEGEDKPLKYPTLFKTASLAILSKMDLAGVVEFDRYAAVKNIRQVAPQSAILELSSRSGDGMLAWYDYLKKGVSEK